MIEVFCMFEIILDLEKSLFKYQYMSNIDYLNSIIDDNYIEMGKSGHIYNKEDTIRDLSCLKEDRNIKIYNYECNELSGNIWIVHYYTKSEGKIIYRTSVWKKEDNFKIVFHQASEYKDNIELIEF